MTETACRAHFYGLHAGIRATLNAALLHPSRPVAGSMFYVDHGRRAALTHWRKSLDTMRHML